MVMMICVAYYNFTTLLLFVLYVERSNNSTNKPDEESWMDRTKSEFLRLAR